MFIFYTKQLFSELTVSFQYMNPSLCSITHINMLLPYCFHTSQVNLFPTYLKLPTSKEHIDLFLIMWWPVVYNGLINTVQIHRSSPITVDDHSKDSAPKTSLRFTSVKQQQQVTHPLDVSDG